jgi:bis(5'-adenosyl)-triphosphatase
VSSKRVVPRVVDLSDDETTDLWMTAKKVGSKLEPHYGANSLTFGIQVKSLFLVFISLTW